MGRQGMTDKIKAAMAPVAARKGGRAGFSLLEVVVSVGIFGFVLSGILAFYTNAVALNEISRNLHTATSHAEYVLEDIRNSAFSTVSTQIASGIWDWNMAAVASKGMTPLKNETVTVTSSGMTLLTIQVTVTWIESSGRARTIVLTTQTGGA